MTTHAPAPQAAEGRRLTDTTYHGKPLAPSADALGTMAEHPPDAPRAELLSQLEGEGYVLLRGLLDRAAVLRAGNEVLRRLGAAGMLEPGQPTERGIARAGVLRAFAPELARNNPALDQVVYGAAMTGLFERLLGGATRHYDYTWLRAKTPGPDTYTAPHYDIVYMGRGTQRVLTAWTPLMDVPLEMGGLMVLERSHQLQDVKDSYGRMDVDSYCRNREEAQDIEAGRQGWSARHNGGSFTKEAQSLPARFDRRWLLADYGAGDVLIFTMFTMHGSPDNRADRFRLSTDTRYQLAGEAIDERWIGANPIAHGVAGKRGLIC